MNRDALVHVGNERLLEEQQLGTPAVRAAMAQFEAAGKSAVAVTVERAGRREAVAMLGLADHLRPDARATINTLSATGVRRIVAVGVAMGAASRARCVAANGAVAALSGWRAVRVPMRRARARPTPRRRARA